MGLSIGADGTQLSLLNNHQKTNKLIGTATERLATSKRINSGHDDPAGLIGAEQLRGDLVEFNSQLRVVSAKRGQVQVQQSGRQIATDVLQEIRGQLIGVTGTFSNAEQRQAVQQQVDSALDAIDRIGATTGFALPDKLQSLRSGGETNIVEGDVAEAVALLDEQLSTITKASAAAGAYERYTLDVDQRLAEDQAVATAAALSQQEDASYAEETSNLVKGQILNEASLKTMVLAQNLRKEGITLLFNSL
jgi:flagellin